MPISFLSRAITRPINTRPINTRPLGFLKNVFNAKPASLSTVSQSRDYGLPPVVSARPPGTLIGPEPEEEDEEERKRKRVMFPTVPTPPYSPYNPLYGATLGAWREGYEKYQKAEEEKRRMLGEWMESQPETYYREYISSLEIPEPQRDYFLNNFGEIYGEYQNELMKQAQTNELPTIKFSDFIKNYNYEQKYMTLPYYMRGGEEQRRLARPTRFLPNW